MKTLELARTKKGFMNSELKNSKEEPRDLLHYFRIHAERAREAFFQERRHRCSLEEELAKTKAELTRYQKVVEILRQGRAWKVFCELRRFSALFLRGVEGGRSAYLNWLLRKLKGETGKKASFDPFDFEKSSSTSNAALVENEPAAEFLERKQQPKEPAQCTLIRRAKARDALCDVIIPVHSSYHWLKSCLQALHEEKTLRDLCRIVIVDDASEDPLKVLEELLSLYPQIGLLRLQEQSGFAVSCNHGAKETEAPYLLFLNSDCLVAPGVISRLIAHLKRDPSIGLICPLANQAVNLSVPLLPGASYREMDAFLEDAAAGSSEVCTVLGHCLLVRRECWQKNTGFDPSWGLGYGEETDLQLRALAQGFHGAVALDCYVYHHAGGTFRYQEDLEQLRSKNLERFIAKWQKEYEALKERTQTEALIEATKRSLQKKKKDLLEPDILFVLPGIAQGVGGIQTVIDLANYLLQRGINAKMLLLGKAEAGALENYQEALFCAPLQDLGEGNLFLEERLLRPRLLVSTSYETTLGSYPFARKLNIPLINFVQGFECYFHGGKDYELAKESYQLADSLLTTSEWLVARLKEIAPEIPCIKLPLGVNSALFFPRDKLATDANRVRVAMIFRLAPDKGQWVLRDIVERLGEHPDKIVLSIIHGTDYEVPAWLRRRSDLQELILPADRYLIARELGRANIFIDSSFHEGFGLMPLEAMASGASVVLADSGGIHQFVRDGVQGLIIPQVNKPERYAEAVLSLAQDKEKLRCFQGEALKQAQILTDDKCFSAYYDFFQAELEKSAQRGKELCN